MSSPCKRIKLTPKSQRNILANRYTQESKVTSTPQRGNGNITSPNISRISSSTSTSSSVKRTTHSDNENLPESDNESISTPTSRSSISFSVMGSEKSSAISVEDCDRYIANFPKVKYTGRIWKLYKPLQDDTLYAKILQNPQDVQAVVTELLLLYNRRPERVICSLLKLCVDVCGFQNFEIADHYTFIEGIGKRVIEMMEGDNVLNQQEVLLNTGRYLLMEPGTNLGKLFKLSIYNFLQKLIIYAHERGILYDDFFAKHFFVFVRCMSFSQIVAIRHTGVTFGIKILTALVTIYSRITNKENVNEMLANIQEQQQEINSYMEFFYLIFVKNCRLQGNSLVLMRVECIYELRIWVRHFPTIFIMQLQTVNYLMKLISDFSKDVRYAALETCEVFVETANVLTILKNAHPDFAEYIGRRFYDVDIKVAVKAIDIYRKLLTLDNSLITINRFKMLKNLVFDKYFPIGEAASRFLICYLEKNQNNQELILMQLTNLSMEPGDAKKQLLVEGCLNYSSALRNWKLYFNIFLNHDIALDTKEALAGLFAESVHQVLTGRSTILREKSRKATISDFSDHNKLASYLSLFPTMLEKYRESPVILIEFLKILATINDAIYDEISDDTVKKICSTMEDFFYYHDNEPLLTKLSETFHYFSNCLTHRDYVQGVIENILSRYTDDLAANLTNENEETTNTVIKIKILFADFNLIAKFEWETIFDSWGDVDQATTANLLVCCKWYLIWCLKSITNENLTARSPIIMRACKEFTSTCFNMLQHLSGEPLHFKTYECLCDVHIAYMKDMEELIKSNKKMELLQLVIDDIQLQNVLKSFLDKYVVCSTTMSVSKRRSYVVKYIDLVHVNVLSIECLANIFKYYYVYNKEYGPLIESSLSDIAKNDENAFLMTILYTLTVIYEQILNKYSVVDPQIQESRDLKLLTKQFMNLKEFRSPRKKFIKLTYFAINYSFKDESKCSFLYFIKYFVDLITIEDEMKEVFTFFKKNIPKGAERNDAVLFLANHFKNFKSKISAGKSKPKTVSNKNKENIKPKKKVVPRAKGRPRLGKKVASTKGKATTAKAKSQTNIDVETDTSDDLTIHDSESDDLEETFTALKV